MNKKTIGKGLLRNEDQRLLKGKGCFSDDVSFDNQVYAAFVRSPHAHAQIKTINTAPAKAKEGVLLCLTGKNWLDDGLAPIPHSPIPSGGDGLGMTPEDWSKVFLGLNFPLAPSRPRFVGEPVAMVVAETAELAHEATELVHIDYEILPAAVETLEASYDNAPRVWDETASNVCLDTTFGNCEQTNKAFSEAHHITRRQFKIARNTGVPMEPRAGVGIYDPKTKKYTLYAGGGGAIRYKKELVEIFGVQPDQIRVVTNDVGGNFGTRNRVFPEYPLVMWAAKKIGRAVKNTTDRTECFLTDFQGRDLITSLEIAMDSNGKFLALKADNLSNIGAYSLSFTPLSKGAEIATGGYDIPYACLRARGVFSNTVPTNPYRSAGRPEVIYALERLVDLAAAEMGLDRIEIRRRNLVPANAMPYANPLGMTYDSGDYHHCLNRALVLSDWNGYQNRKGVSQHLGMCRGIGICSYIESSSGAPLERAEIKIKKDNKSNIPLLLKVSPDIKEDDISEIVDVATQNNISAIILTNTTNSNRDNLKSESKKEEGGLSGEPLQQISTNMIKKFYKQLHGKIPIIGVGGVNSGKSAYEKIIAGASLLQLYTGFVYRGPSAAKDIKKELIQILKAEGISNIKEAVGKGI